MCVPGRNVGLCFGLWNPPTASFPILFRHPGLPIAGKHSVFHVIHRHVRSFLFGVINLATCMCVKSEEERPGEKNPLQYFEFWINPTYSTFKDDIEQEGECEHCVLRRCRSQSHQNKSMLRRHNKSPASNIQENLSADADIWKMPNIGQYIGLGDISVDH